MLARILIVDDDPAIRELLRDHFKAGRHEVFTAADGAEAFTIAEKEVPHLIIMDVVMSGVYGTTAIKRLHDFYRTEKIPIIAISGSVEASLLGDLLKDPLLRFLKKPVDLKRLDAAVKELLPMGGYIP